MLSLKTSQEIQVELAEAMVARRKALRHTRKKASEVSGVPAPTIRHFEGTGEISLRQFLMLVSIYGNLDAAENLLPRALTPSEVKKEVEAALRMRWDIA